MADNSTSHADELGGLARRRFGKLSEAEGRLIRAAPKGEVTMCGPNFDATDPANDPAKADHGWGREREIRAEVICWLCLDPEASKRVAPHGVRSYAESMRD